MSRPQIIVNVSAAIPRRGAPTATGTAFFAYAGATGDTTPTRCLTSDDAADANAPDNIVAWVGDALAEGAPEVVLVRAAAVAPETVTEAEWTTALDTFSDEFGMGQVCIPGVSDANAHTALLAHAAATGRTVLLDGAADDDATALVTAATGLAAATGAERAGLFAPWVTLPGPGGVTRDVPPSVLVTGLTGRGDARVGHTNHAPAGDQGVSAGVIRNARTVVTTFTNDELDDLHDAGVSAIKQVNGRTTLYGWRALSDDARFRQLNTGRMMMQLSSGIFAALQQYLFRQIDGRGQLYAEVEGALRGYLAPLWAADALYGETADDAFDVAVAAVNTPTLAAAGELRSAVSVVLTQHAEKITIDVVTSLPEGAAA